MQQEDNQNNDFNNQNYNQNTQGYQNNNQGNNENDFNNQNDFNNEGDDGQTEQSGSITNDPQKSIFDTTKTQDGKKVTVKKSLSKIKDIFGKKKKS